MGEGAQDMGGTSLFSGGVRTRAQAGRVGRRRISLTLSMAVAATMVVVAVPASPALAASLVVNSTDQSPDANPGDGVCLSANASCTLVAAIQEANANPGADTITFAIPGAGLHVIAPSSALPTLNGPATLDATTQPGASCAAWPPTLTVELDLTNGGTLSAAGGVTIRGLAVTKFTSTGVNLTGTNNVLECNFIGADTAGTPTTTGTWAVEVNGNSNRIGGPSPWSV